MCLCECGPVSSCLFLSPQISVYVILGKFRIWDNINKSKIVTFVANAREWSTIPFSRATTLSKGMLEVPLCRAPFRRLLFD
jgi:hypothetical protein